MSYYPTQEELRLSFTDGGHVPIDIVAGNTSWVWGHYYITKYKGKTYISHKLLWILRNGPIPEGMEVDHKSLNKLDNSINNLRLSTRGQNIRNRPKSSKSTNPHKGVWFDKGRWRARITVDGVRHNFGPFDSPEEANIVAVLKREELHGEFANHG